MPGSSELSFSRIRTAPPTLHLMSWPLRDEPFSTTLLVVLMVVAALGAQYCTGRWAMGLLVGAGFLTASWPLWLPVRFELGAKGIIRSVLGWRRRVSWSEFGTYQIHTHGVFLAPHTEPTPFRAIR